MGGFSQGGMTTLSTFLRYGGPTPLGGVFGLSTLLPLETDYMDLSNTALKAQSETPMLLYNGVTDATLNITQAQSSFWIFENYVYSRNPSNLEIRSEEGLGHY